MGALLLSSSGPAKGPKWFLSSNISRAKSFKPYFMMLCQARASNHNICFIFKPSKGHHFLGTTSDHQIQFSHFWRAFLLPICSSSFGRENLRDFVEAASIHRHEPFKLNSTRAKSTSMEFGMRPLYSFRHILAIPDKATHFFQSYHHQRQGVI